MLKNKKIRYIVISAVIILIIAAFIVPQSAPYRKNAMKKEVSEYLKNKYGEEFEIREFSPIDEKFMGLKEYYIVGVVPVNNRDIIFNVQYLTDGVGNGGKFLVDSYPLSYWNNKNYIEIKEYIYDIFEDAGVL